MALNLMMYEHRLELSTDAAKESAESAIVARVVGRSVVDCRENPETR